MRNAAAAHTHEQRRTGREELATVNQETCMTTTSERLWNVGDVSAFLGIPVNTLYQWRHQGYGPKSCRVGRHVRYDPAEVRRWFASLADSGTA